MAGVIDYRFRIRRRTAANWVSLNEILLDSEIGLESDTKLFKFGDGATAWNALAYRSLPPYFCTAGGTANALTGTFAFTPVLIDGITELNVRATAANTGAATFNSLAINKLAGTALAANDIAGAGHEMVLRYVSGSPGHYVLLNPAATNSGGTPSPGSDLFVNTTPVGNVGTGEDDLMSYSMPGGTLGTNGQRVIWRASIKAANNVNTKRLRAYFGGTLIFDSVSTIPISAADDIIISVEIVRISGTSQTCNVSLVAASATGAAQAKITATTITLSTAAILKITGEATSNDDLQQQSMTVSLAGPLITGGAVAWTNCGHWNFSTDGAVSQFFSSAIGAYSEALIVFDQVSMSSAGWRQIQVSVDGGSTYLSTAGNYRSIDTNGVITNEGALLAHSTSSTLARSANVGIHLMNCAAYKPVDTPARGSALAQIVTTSTITNLRVFASAGNFNGGTIQIWCR